MTKLIAMVALAGMAVAGAVNHKPEPKPTDAQVEAAIDARLHELLVKLNSQAR